MGFGDEIMVIPTSKLFDTFHFNGFLPHRHFDFEKKIIDNHSYIIRTQELEDNPEYKQPIPYTTIINHYSKKVFVYQRAKKDKDYTEKKLQGKWSIGLCGHIEKVDAIDSKENPIINSLLRELNEEVIFPGKINNVIKLGYINDDQNAVGKVHFGILYCIPTLAEFIRPLSAEIASAKFVTLEELTKICSQENVESWTKIALEPLKNYMLRI